MARVQCAGCGKIISDDGEPGGTYGCCAECNGHTFRSKEAEMSMAMLENAAELSRGTIQGATVPDVSETVTEAEKSLTPEE